MLKKEVLNPITRFFLSFVYLVISSIIGLSKGNSYLIKQKFKIGILLLSLSTIIACKTNKTTCYKTNSTKNSEKKDSINNSNNKTIDNKNHPPPTCYAPPPPKK